MIYCPAVPLSPSSHAQVGSGATITQVGKPLSTAASLHPCSERAITWTLHITLGWMTGAMSPHHKRQA